MDDIKLSNIIRIDNLDNYKIHAAVWNGTKEPLDAYLTGWEEWLGWNSWRSEKKDRFKGADLIFSLMRFYHDGNDIWLFGGIFRILETHKDRYKIEEVKDYSEYIGRLKIKMKSPGRTVTPKLKKFYHDMHVFEILREPYNGEPFPGYENIAHKFHLLKPIFDNHRDDWKNMLENIKGIYVITDESNGKHYVGSAYSDGGSDCGIWSRWGSYLDTGHGNNEQLVELINKKGKEYALNNFSMTLLEYFPMKKDKNYITDREEFWKKVFSSKKHGYNSN